MTYEEFGPEEPRGWSPLAVALIATLVLLLGLGGALFGINVANRNAAAVVTDPTPTTAPPPTSASPSVTASASAGPTSPPPATDTFALPDLSPLDFVAARAKVRELKLGWRLVFEGSTNDSGVRASDPPAGTQVKKGETVKIFVKGAAPLATVPAVVGKSCDEAAGLIVESGLYPRYLASKTGTVVSQNPTADAPPALHWNDELEIRCGG